MSKKNLALSVVILLILPMLIAAVDLENDPGWLIFEKGKQLFDSGEYGQALLHFRLARERVGDKPELEYWIGKVFEAEGELDLAVSQYTTALENASYLEVRDDVYDILRGLAEIAFTRKSFAEYASLLQHMIERDETARESTEGFSLDKRILSRAVGEKGIDKLLELYRLSDYGGHEAYYKLGVYKLVTGHNEEAVKELLYAVIITFTTVIEYFKDLDPEYRFTSVADTLRLSRSRRPAADYLLATDAYGQLYALGVALRESQQAVQIEIANDIFRLVRDNSSGYWEQRAAAQLRSPFDEDFMIVF